MPDLFNFTPEMERYFGTLSEEVQASIMHCGAKINSLEDLKAVAEECFDNENA